jgi:hypothetical protein
MARMSQFELADRLKMERTSALRMFKAATAPGPTTLAPFAARLPQR